MAGTSMNVNAGNIIAGPCTSFQVDGVEVGGTSGGVSAERKMTFNDVEVDQVVGVVKKILTKDEITVTTTLSEATLANLQLAWGISQAPVVNTSPANTTLNVGVEKAPVEHTLTFVGPCPPGTSNYKTRTVTFYRAINMVSAKLDFMKDKEQQYQVSFQCLPDLTKQDGSQYGTVVDQ